jgi:hypothetical protein
MGKVASRVIDAGLVALKNEATHVYLCSAEPADYVSATTTLALGNKNFGAGNCFTGPVDRTPNGRKVTTVAVTNGVITGAGTATRYAVVDAVNSRLLVDENLGVAQPVIAGNVFSMPAFDFGLPGS